MKFLQKINRQYLLILTVLLLLISLSGYFLLQVIIKKEIKEDIQEKEYAIVREIQSQNNLVSIYPIIETKKISKTEIQPKSYKEIYLMDEAKDEKEVYLEYTHSVKINNQWYLIKIRHSLLETNDLILAIALPLLLLLVLAFSFSFLITKKLNKTLWKDFEENLKHIENYSFKNTQKLVLKETGIEEFDKINTTIMEMTGKLRTDYFSLKEFTENASHEIQTPLSVIRNKMEMMLNDKGLTEEQSAAVQTIYKTVTRLSKLNRSLLLLTKIENRQYDSKKPVHFEKIIRETKMEFDEIISMKELKFQTEIQGTPTIEMDADLARILIENLLSNAIKYTENGNEIIVKLNRKALIISNSGQHKFNSGDRIFDRFVKENQSSSSVGLGLSIVHKICLMNNFDISYDFAEGKHIFKINFI